MTQYSEHVARAGETWDEIAFRAYRSERMSYIIIKANPRYIDRIRFEGGEVIRVPIVEEVENTETLPPWRRD